MHINTKMHTLTEILHTNTGLPIVGELETIHTLTAECSGLVVTDGVLVTDIRRLPTLINVCKREQIDWICTLV